VRSRIHERILEPDGRRDKRADRTSSSRGAGERLAIDAIFSTDEHTAESTVEVKTDDPITS